MSGANSLWLVLILALNFAVSWWNARACGRAWVESKAVGGMVRFLVWCGAVQSAIGFSSVFLFPLVFMANAAFPQYFTDEYVKAAVNLWYITVIFPALGSGLTITIESWIAAYRDHSLMNIGRAAYNTLAQAHNTINAIESVGPAFRAVADVFSSALSGRGSAKDKAATIGLLIAMLLVVTALAAGIILTATLIHRYAGAVPLPSGPQGAPSQQPA